MDSTKFIFEESIPYASSASDGAQGADMQHELLTPPDTEDTPDTEDAQEEGGKAEAPPEERQASGRAFGFLRLINITAGLIFCAVTVLFCLSGVISAVDRYLIEDGKSLMLSEVTAGSIKFVGSDAAGGEKEDRTSEDAPPSAAPEPEEYPISDYDLSAGADGAFTLNNQTSFSPDIDRLISTGNTNRTPKEIYDEYGREAPVVLIVHTHGTEGYSGGGATYTKEDSFRSDNIEENVVAIGTVMEEVFRAAGINALHCTEMFDAESYKDSYSRSFAAVSEYLKEYPSVSYVFDVHRDSIIRDDLTKVCPVGDFNGERVAQAMLVVGTDEGGADHGGWDKNLALALDVQKNLFALSGNVARKINLRSAAFNQGLSSGGLLLEIGSCGNTLTEAKRSAVLAAIALSDSILKAPCGLSPEVLMAQLAG